jgi:hypothetical protein
MKMYHPRTLDFVSWERFLESKDNNATFTLDFHIDAGFSFTNAVAFREMKATGKSVTLDELEIPILELNFSRLYIKGGILVRSISIESCASSGHDTTEKYLISACFSLKKIGYTKIESDVEKEINKNREVDRASHLRVYLSSLLLQKATILRDEIISFIEFSGFLARQIPSTLNLYLLQGGYYFRITQVGGGQETAGHNPIHPLAVKTKEIIAAYEHSLTIPENLRKHFAKGIHYKFLGFYDESFLCFYKIIESRFRSDSFCKMIAIDLFNMTDGKLISTIKTSNAKAMMLFIYQKLIKSESDGNGFTELQKSELMNNLVDITEARNKIAHTADHSAESKRLLEFTIGLSKYMIASLKNEETSTSTSTPKQ